MKEPGRSFPVIQRPAFLIDSVAHGIVITECHGSADEVATVTVLLDADALRCLRAILEMFEGSIAP